MPQTPQQVISKAALMCLALFTAFSSVSAPVALLTGGCFALLFGNPLPALTAKGGKFLLKAAVVGLGFGINIQDVIAIGKESLLLTLFSIAATLLLGHLLGIWLQVSGNTRALVTFGTAICGGSAIAALAPVIKAKDEEIAVSLATVFFLNAVGLVLFPVLGHLFDLGEQQFGLWAALAIHDTSSVVGATATYGALALATGTTVKLTRALWIVPCTMIAGAYCKSKEKIAFPFFIVGFVAATIVNTFVPELETLWQGTYDVAKRALIVTLFLIGTELTRQTLRQVGIRPLLLGVTLWVCVSAAVLTLLLQGYIG